MEPIKILRNLKPHATRLTIKVKGEWKQIQFYGFVDDSKDKILYCRGGYQFHYKTNKNIMSVNDIEDIRLGYKP